jgi:O-antigen/teichoic acid export membrane protein
MSPAPSPSQEKFPGIPGLSLPSLWSAGAAFWQRAFASDFAWKVGETFATRVFLLGAGVAAGVLVARSLGPEGRGLFAVATALAGMCVQFGNLGLHTANAYFVARDRSLMPRLAGNSLAVSAVVGGLAVAGLWALASFRPDIVPLRGALLVLTCVSVPVSLGYMLLQNLLMGVQDVRSFNRIEILVRLVSLTLIVLVILERRVTPEAIFAAGLLASGVGLIRVLRRLGRFLPERPRPSPGLLREHMVYGLKSYLACFFAYLVVRFDLLMVSSMLGTKEAGYYSIAASMADLVYMLPSVIGTLLFPKLVARPTQEEKWRLTAGVGATVLVVMVGVSSLSALLARPLIRLLFGADFLPATPAFVILAIAMIFYGVNNIVSSYLASMSFPWFSVGVWIAAAGLNVVLNLLLIPARGILGASISSLVCYVLVLVAHVLYCARTATWRRRPAHES